MNKHIKETSIKYLAGLADADGSLVLVRKPEGLRVRFALGQSVEGHKVLEELQEEFGCGIISVGYNPRMKYWTVGKISDLNQLLPRLMKHMIIKAKHWQRLLDAVANQTEIDSKESRKDSGPLRTKNYPSLAWIAGYLDGDGHFSNTVQKNGKGSKYRAMRMGAVSHINDLIALQYLQKVYGGKITEEGETIRRWYRSLGWKDSSFVFKSLTKIVKHSRIKKHKIEQLIHTHRQRLSEKAPTGEAIV